MLTSYQTLPCSARVISRFDIRRLHKPRSGGSRAQNLFHGKKLHGLVADTTPTDFEHPPLALVAGFLKGAQFLQCDFNCHRYILRIYKPSFITGFARDQWNRACDVQQHAWYVAASFHTYGSAYSRFGEPSRCQNDGIGCRNRCASWKLSSFKLWGLSFLQTIAKVGLCVDSQHCSESYICQPHTFKGPMLIEPCV